MKRNNYTTISHILSGILFVIFAFSLHSCIDEEFSGNKPNDQEEAIVRLTITTPGTSLPKSATRSLTNTEYAVTDIKLLVFSQVGDDYLFSYMVNGQQITPNEENPLKTNFTARLKSSDTPIKLVLIANSNNIFDSYIPTLNTLEDTVRKQVITQFNGESPDTLPMFGEKILTSLNAKEVNTIQVTMLRAIARVDVEIDLDMTKSRNFILESVHIYRANDLIQIIPDDETIQKGITTLRATAPSVPSTSTHILPYNKTISESGTIIEKLYLPEAKACDNPATQYNEITCIVVGGYYNDETTPTYYRADFNSREANHSFGQVLRNHRYHFTVKAVNGSGWETPDEAANNRATNIIMEIQEWEDFTMEMYVDGEKYLGVDSRNLIFGYEEGLRKVIGIQSTVPYKISWIDQNEAITPGEDKTISNDYFSVQISTTPNLTTDMDVSYLIVTTLTDNNKVNNPSESSYYSELKVEWANWIFYISITQKHVSHYIKDPSKMRSIRILSANIGGTGQLGTATQAASGVGIRRLLDNPDYFSPTGTIDYISGFSFSAAPRDWYMYADPNSSNANYRSYANKVKTETYSADVIYLNNDNAITPFAAEVILEWLNSSPNRVLIVGCDNSDTSNALLQEFPNRGYKGLLKDEVDFWYNQGAGTHYQVKEIGNDQNFNLINDERDSEREEFYNGPFGKVAAGTQFQCIDYYYGYTRNYDESKVLPLLSHGNAKDFTSMSIGINKKRKIIYYGDASMWESGPFNLNYNGTNGTLGTISTDVHRFWANMWAWITHQVIWNDNELIE